MDEGFGGAVGYGIQQKWRPCVPFGTKVLQVHHKIWRWELACLSLAYVLELVAMLVLLVTLCTSASLDWLLVDFGGMLFSWGLFLGGTSLFKERPFPFLCH
jgi:hypothetical protein